MNFAPLTITLPHHDWNYVVGILRQQPMSDVENLVAEMRRQVEVQTTITKEESNGRPADNAAA